MLLMMIIPGTVKIREIVIDPEGNVVAYRSQPSPSHYLESRKGAEFYADEVWQGVVGVIQGLTADCPHPEEIAALSLASMEIGVALDEHGVPLAPTQLWFDTRSHKTLQKWLETVDEFEIDKRSGMRVYAYSSLSKMLYEREHMPDVYRRTRKWVYLVSYFLHKMVGQYALAPSVLCRSHLYDIHQGEWSDELCALTGTDRSLHTMAEYARAIQAIGPERCILSSCGGQGWMPVHTSAWEEYLEAMRENGLTQEDMNVMTKVTPARLLGLEVCCD